MKWLLTGGAGFVGSHLAESILAKGNDVSIIDDLSTGTVANIQHLKGKERFRYVFDTIMDRNVMAELVDEADIILHLAAAVGVRLIIENPVRTIETNVQGTKIVLDLCSKKRKRVLIFSSSEVYGKSNATSFSETDDLILGPTFKSRWGYAASKIVDEFLALAYCREKKVPVTIVRLFNTVGPRQTGRYGMVLPSFVQQALADEPITVFGDGKQTRTFTHVKDAVSAILSLVEHPDAFGEIFNIGGNQEVAIANLAGLVKECTQSSSPIVYVPYDEAYSEGFEDLRRRVPDISKITRVCGYSPSFTLDDIVTDVVQYQRNHPRSYDRLTVK